MLMSDEQQEKRIDIIEMVQKSPDGTHYVDIAPDAASHGSAARPASGLFISKPSLNPAPPSRSPISARHQGRCISTG
jgi:hypothetical protein